MNVWNFPQTISRQQLKRTCNIFHEKCRWKQCLKFSTYNFTGRPKKTLKIFHKKSSPVCEFLWLVTFHLFSGADVFAFRSALGYFVSTLLVWLSWKPNSCLEAVPLIKKRTVIDGESYPPRCRLFRSLSAPSHKVWHDFFN